MELELGTYHASPAKVGLEKKQDSNSKGTTAFSLIVHVKERHKPQRKG
jgi:hypothetical protein